MFLVGGMKSLHVWSHVPSRGWSQRGRGLVQEGESMALPPLPNKEWQKHYLPATSFAGGTHKRTFIAVRKLPTVVAERLCFHMCLWFCSQGGWQKPLPSGQTPPLGRHTPTPRQTHHRADTPPGQTPPGQPLQRTVRILVECILVFMKIYPVSGLWRAKARWKNIPSHHRSLCGEYSET